MNKIAEKKFEDIYNKFGDNNVTMDALRDDLDKMEKSISLNREHNLDDINNLGLRTEDNLSHLERHINMQLEKNHKEMERVRMEMSDTQDSKQE